MTKKIALAILVLQVCILLAICVLLYETHKYYSGEIVEDLSMVVLLISGLYHSGITIWSYFAYRKSTTTKDELGFIFIIGILPTMILLLLAIN
jgi:hypothetical protein